MTEGGEQMTISVFDAADIRTEDNVMYVAIK